MLLNVGVYIDVNMRPQAEDSELSRPQEWILSCGWKKNRAGLFPRRKEKINKLDTQSRITAAQQILQHRFVVKDRRFVELSGCFNVLYVLVICFFGEVT